LTRETKASKGEAKTKAKVGISWLQAKAKAYDQWDCVRDVQRSCAANRWTW